MHPRRILFPLALIAGLLATTQASAASITLATGRVDPDTSGFGEATTANLRLGAEVFDIGLAEFDAELEIARDIDSGDAPGGNEYEFSSVGVALSARTAGPLYFIGRYGIARNEIDVDGGGDATENQQSIGLGVGGSIGILQLEVMATQYADEGDLDDITWITAGIRF